MRRTLEDIEAVVRERICRICTDRTITGECGLDNPSTCALFRLFPQVARAIQSTDSDDIRDYIQSIRAQVCSVCSEQAADGSCQSRQMVACALDAYLIPVIDAIEEAAGKKFDRSKVVKSPNSPPGKWAISR
jgi:hypothetical protein